MAAVEQTLVLNATFAPLKIVPWMDAMVLWAKGKVEIVHTHDRETRSVSFAFKIPSVVRLLRYVKLAKRPMVQFNRANIFTRDDFTCQYCAREFASQDLTYDHVVPESRGGRRNWENIVTACEPCNRKKADRTPEEAGMTLIRKPCRPTVLAPTVKLTLNFKTPPSWRDFLYWHVKLDTT